jgi:VIT1/CCC1 family predicted Fe2+/Mn2+ transporter
MSMTQQVSIQEMVNQSRAIITSPSVATFERYERHGNMTNAAIYVAIAAVISGLVGLINGPNGLLSGLIGTMVQFFVFTGLVFFIGKNLANGTGTWDEVAYTFSLFWAPLSVIGSLVGAVILLLAFVPIINILAGLAGLVISLALLVVNIYFGYLAVQSSMNITDQGKAILTLVLAAVGSFIVLLVVGSIFS